MSSPTPFPHSRARRARNIADDGRCAAGHRPQPDGSCPVCFALAGERCNGGQVSGRRPRSCERTPAKAKRAHHIGRLQALSTQSSIQWADAHMRGDHRAAVLYQDDAEALAAGAAALRQPPTQPFIDVLRALLRRDGPDAHLPTGELIAKAHQLVAEADRHG